MAPTRNATAAVRTTVTIVKRRDMPMKRSETLPVLDYKLLKRLLIQRFDAKLPCLFQLAPRVAPGDQIRRLLAHRSRHACAEPLERFRCLLARHVLERSGQDEHLPCERTGDVGGFRRLARHVDAGGSQTLDQGP